MSYVARLSSKSTSNNLQKKIDYSLHSKEGGALNELKKNFFSDQKEVLKMLDSNELLQFSLQKTSDILDKNLNKISNDINNNFPLKDEFDEVKKFNSISGNFFIIQDYSQYIDSTEQEIEKNQVKKKDLLKKLQVNQIKIEEMTKGEGENKLAQEILNNDSDNAELVKINNSINYHQRYLNQIGAHQDEQIPILYQLIDNLVSGSQKEIKGMTVNNSHWTSFKMKYDRAKNEMLLESYNSLGGIKYINKFENTSNDNIFESKEESHLDKILNRYLNTNLKVKHNQICAKQTDAVSCGYYAVYNLNKEYFNKIGISHEQLKLTNEIEADIIFNKNNNPIQIPLQNINQDIFDKQLQMACFVIGVKNNYINSFFNYHENSIEDVVKNYPSKKEDIIQVFKRNLHQSCEVEDIDRVFENFVINKSDEIMIKQVNFNKQDFEKDLKALENQITDNLTNLSNKIEKDLANKIQILNR